MALQTAYGLGRLAIRATPYLAEQLLFKHPRALSYLGAMAIRNRFRRRRMRRRFGRSMLGKRSRGFGGFGPRKRARFGRRFQATTAQRPRFLSNNFRTRRLSRRRWKAVLWRDTTAVNHWRSFKTVTWTWNPGASPVETIVGLEAMLNGDALQINDPTPFWTGTGGVQPNTSTSGIPEFVGNDIVLRGGMATIQFSAPPEATSPYRIRIWVVAAIANPDLAKWQAVTTGVKSSSWDPSAVPEFRQDFGRILMSRETLLTPGAMPVEFKWRQTVQKIEQTVWRGVGAIPGPPQPGGSKLYWMYAVIPTLSGVNPAMQIVRGYNLSFSGDTA